MTASPPSADIRRPDRAAPKAAGGIYIMRRVHETCLTEFVRKQVTLSVAKAAVSVNKGLGRLESRSEQHTVESAVLSLELEVLPDQPEAEVCVASGEDTVSSGKSTTVQQALNDGKNPQPLSRC